MQFWPVLASAGLLTSIYLLLNTYHFNLRCCTVAYLKISGRRRKFYKNISRNCVCTCHCIVVFPYLLKSRNQVRVLEHRRRSSVNFGGGKTFLPENMHEKLTKCPNFTWYVPEKLTKFPNFTWYMPEKVNKMPEFYMSFARKIYFARIFFGGEGGKCPPAPRLLCLCLKMFYAKTF